MDTDRVSLVPRDHPSLLRDARILSGRDVVRPVFRHRKTALRVFLGVAVIALAVAFAWPRQYQASMKILVKPDRLPTDSEDARSARVEVSDSDVGSEVVLLKSRDLLQSVAEASGLVPAAGKRDPRSVALAVVALERNLSVTPLRKTTLIDVSYSARTPEAAAKVLSNLARLYLEKHLAVHRPPGAREFLDQQAERLRQELRTAETRLVDFGKAQHVVSAATEKDATLQKLTEFQATLEQLHAQAADANRRFAALQQQLATTPDRLTTTRRVQDNGELVRDLTGKVLDLEIKRTEMLRKFTPTYPPVVELEQQLRQARTALAAAQQSPINDVATDQNPTYLWLRNESAKVEAERQALQAREAATAATIRDYQDRARRLDEQSATEQDLTRSVKAAEANYLLYQRKAEESRLSEALDQRRIANVSVAEAPTVPALPTTPRSLLLLAGLVAAAILGLGTAFLLEYMDPRFRTRHEIEAVLDLPVLAAIPASVPK